MHLSQVPHRFVHLNQIEPCIVMSSSIMRGAGPFKIVELDQVVNEGIVQKGGRHRGFTI